jgi:hypothetical protein
MSAIQPNGTEEICQPSRRILGVEMCSRPEHGFSGKAEQSAAILVQESDGLRPSVEITQRQEKSALSVFDDFSAAGRDIVSERHTPHGHSLNGYHAE